MPSVLKAIGQSLTSTMRKVKERLVTNRLCYFAECQNLTLFQAKFRTGHSTEDQLLRLSQSISNGFQRVPMQRTVMALIDYSRTYGKVWLDVFLFKMQQMGVPTKMIQWVQARLFNRLNWMTFNGEQSKMVILKQGVPQGSVLLPILFLFYINDLLNGIAQSNRRCSCLESGLWSTTSRTELANYTEPHRGMDQAVEDGTHCQVRMLFFHHQHAQS